MSARHALGMALAAILSQAGVMSTASAASPAVYADDLVFADFLARDTLEIVNGKQLVDVEVRDAGGTPRFSGVWYPVNGTTWRWIHGGQQEWDDFLDLVKTKDGRWLDIEVGIFNGQKRWSGIFLEDGDAYAWAVDTTSTDAQFQTLLDTNMRAGRQIIDFEAYEESGQTRYGGAWVNDPNQPRTVLYYGLTSAEVNDLFDPQYPIDPGSGITPIEGIAGRPIDFERYYSTTHGEQRYAVIMAMVAGHEWALWFGRTKAELNQDIANESDDNTHLIDLEVYESGGSLRYAGIWGDDYKSLHEVAAIPAEQDPEPLSANLQNLITQYEASDGTAPLGIVGLYAKNTRTNQSIGYRATEPFYLASTSKVAIHIKLWQEVEAGLNLTQTVPFTKNPWYVEDRGDGVNQTSGLHQNFFGQNISLNTYDRVMMRISDNSATSLIVENAVGREKLNTWLAGVPGVGRGWGPVTGITDLDRVIHWQGQVENFPSDPSYFLIPSWRFEPLFRGMGDVFGDMQAWANANNGGTIPNYSWTQGHLRYFRMGLNTAEPRAFGSLLEKYMDGDLFSDPVNTLPASLTNWGTGTQIVDNLDGTALFPGFPPLPEPTSLTVYAKNGGKGSANCDGTRYDVRDDVAIVQKGPETVVFIIMTKENLTCQTGCNIPLCRQVTASPPGNAIRSFWHARFGYELFSRLVPDLKDAGAPFHAVSSRVASPNSSWWAFCRINNARGGDALPYKVDFYASLDTVIKPAEDYLLGTFQAPTRHLGDSTAGVLLDLQDFPPSVPFGQTYYIGAVIDGLDEVGEWDDRLADNTFRLIGPDTGNIIQVSVELSLKAPDGDQDGDVDLDDFLGFGGCAKGPAVPIARACVDWDFDFDNDVDDADFGVFQRCLSGAGMLWDPDCVPPPPT